jgi:hypothetical protein
VGDPRHASRKSEHNPDPNGVVRAIDITHDVAHGCDAGRLAQHLRNLGARGDRRVLYVIWDRAIVSAKTGWKWVPYSGANLHTSHVHLSVTPTDYDDTYSWDVARLVQKEEDDDMDLKTFSDYLGRALHGEKIGRTELSFAASLDAARKAASGAEVRAISLQDQLGAVQAQQTATALKLAAIEGALQQVLAKLSQPGGAA